MTAKPIAGIPVRVIPDSQGQKWIEVDIQDFDDVRKLPKALSFNGIAYGWSCWNSDRKVSIYRTGAMVNMAYATVS